MSGPSLEAVSRTFPADLSSVRRARDVVRDTLHGWRADAIYDDVVLVASELISNALQHGLRLDVRAGREPWAEGRSGAAGDPRRDAEPSHRPPGDVAANDVAANAVATVELSLRRDGEHVICAVTDPSQEPPVRRCGDVLAGSGHGLQLVDSLSLCWGWNVHQAERIRPGRPPEAGPRPPAAGPAPGRGKSVWAVFPLRIARGAA